MVTVAAASAEAQPNGIVSNLRAAVSAAAELAAGVERALNGTARTARDNAWEAIQEDRARARARDEMDQLVRSLLAESTRTPPAGHAPGAHPQLAASLLQPAGHPAR